jgi:hypothetical protein
VKACALATSSSSSASVVRIVETPNMAPNIASIDAKSNAGALERPVCGATDEGARSSKCRGSRRSIRASRIASAVGPAIQPEAAKAIN